VAKDSGLTAQDVEMPAERPSDILWREQQRRWPAPAPRPHPSLAGEGATR
jgi:hypothetical protein